MRHLRWIYPYLRPDLWRYAIALVLSAAEGWFFLALVGVQKWIIDDVFMNGNYGRLTPILLAFGGIFLGYTLLNLSTMQLLMRNEARLVKAFGRTLVHYLHRIPIGQLQQERTAKYVHYFTNDATQGGRTIANDVLVLIQQSLMVVFLIIVLGMASLPMLLFVTVLSVLFIWIGRRFAPAMRDVSREVQDRKTDLMIHLEEGISSTREVISYNRTEWETKRYHALFGKLFAQVMKEGAMTNKQLAVAMPIKWGASLLVLALGGYELMQGNMTLGLFVIVYQYSFQYMDTLNNVFNFSMLLSGRFAFIDRLIDAVDGEQIDEGTERLVGPIRSLRLNGLSFAYRADTPQVLRDLAIDLPIGRKIAFVGMSGGGKSTIAQLLIRFFEPGNGSLEANGVPLHRIRRDEWTERVGIVFQDPYLLPDTIRTNLTLGREELDEARIVEACRSAHIHEVFSALPAGYETEVGERGITLSGGQRQRLALARAFLGDPEVLILDEATSALDLETERRVMAELDRMRAGRTTIIIAHRLSTIMNADVIYVMDAGRIAETGTHAELMTGDTIYRRLVHAQEREELVESGIGA